LKCKRITTQRGERSGEGNKRWEKVEEVGQRNNRKKIRERCI